MSQKNILFVDDETNILSGLKRMLRPLRKEMSFHFAESGESALSLLSQEEVNVIVSDMRMPGMDGAALLTTVQEQYPHIIRIMLTGHAHDASVLRTIPVVHQFLAKPSDPETLKEVITRACALQELMSNERLKTLIAGLGSLPSLPSVYAELQEQLKDPECAIGDVAEIIEKDLAMSAKVLQLVNSAFFGIYKTVESPARAVNLLGLDTVKALVLGVGVFSELKAVARKGFTVSSLWSHSIGTAAFAKAIASAETDDKSIVDNSFIAGIIHDIGKLLLFSSLGEEYIQAVETASSGPLPLYRAEEEVFYADHGDVGGYLIGLWGLTGSVVEAIAFHHRLDQYPEASFSPAVAVHCADVVYHRLNPDQCIGEPPALNQAYLDAAGIGNRFEVWWDLCKEMQKGVEQDD